MECHAKGIKIETSYDYFSTGPSYMNADPHQLERALQNILDNAYRYANNLLELSINIHGNFFIITTKNDGADMKDLPLEQIFQRFYTSNQHNVEDHLGLGLFIAKTLITAMKGYFEATPQKDIITFKVSIPLSH